MKQSVFLRQATHTDNNAIRELLNTCYRADRGWTNEAHLVSGIRITSAAITAVIDDKTHYLFVYPKTQGGGRLHTETGEILATIAVHMDLNGQGKTPQQAYIGMFAVHPQYQNQGVGGVLLSAAETFAHRHLSNDDSQLCYATMSILNHRPELLAYYQRRGYQLTGDSLPFPNDGNNGQPRRTDLKLLQLKKQLHNSR